MSTTSPPKVIHSRERLIVPEPHVTLHSVHSDHCFQPGGGTVLVVVVAVVVDIVVVVVVTTSYKNVSIYLALAKMSAEKSPFVVSLSIESKDYLEIILEVNLLLALILSVPASMAASPARVCCSGVNVGNCCVS